MSRPDRWLSWQRFTPTWRRTAALSDLAPRQNVKFDRNGTTISGYLQLPPAGRGPGLIVIQ